VAIVLARHAGKTGDSFPSLTKICKEAAIERATAVKALRVLETNGWFTRRTGMGVVTHYQLVHQAHWFTTPTGTRGVLLPVHQAHSDQFTRRTVSNPLTTQLTTQLAETVPAPRAKASRPLKISLEMLPVVQDVMTRMEKVRGYVSPCYGAEMQAAQRMVKDGFPPDVILDCYRHFKAEPFWATKELKLMTVAGNIQAWKAGRNGTGGQGGKSRKPFGNHTIADYEAEARRLGQPVE